MYIYIYLYMYIYICPVSEPMALLASKMMNDFLKASNMNVMNHSSQQADPLYIFDWLCRVIKII